MRTRRGRVLTKNFTSEYEMERVECDRDNIRAGQVRMYIVRKRMYSVQSN